MMPKELEVSLDRYGAYRGYPTSAWRCITGVLNAADHSHLPPFAATLGLRYEEFSLIQRKNSQDSLLHSPFYFEMLSDWVPDLFPPLIEMLWDHHSGDDEVTWWVAHAIACACFGQRNLWLDLGLRSREELSRLLESRFSRLYILNKAGMNWKRFIFQELGQRLEIPNFIPPGSDKCDHFRLCLEP